MIKVVLFDFGGVLTESGKQGFIAQTIAQLYGLPPEQIDIRDLHSNLRRGKIDEQTFFEELNRRYGQPGRQHITQKMFLDKVHAAFKPSPAIYKLAEELRARGIRTAILSNIFDMNAELLRKQGWYNGFDPVFLSSKEGYAKPDPEIYRIAIDRLGVKPGEILFIDDQAKCLPPAKQAGIRTLLAVSPKQIVAETKGLLQELNGLSW